MTRQSAPYPREPRASVERLARGEFFTAAPVAELALAALAPFTPGSRVLDPTCGDGSFLAAAYRLGFTDVVGLDIDRAAAAKARARVPAANVTVGDLLHPSLVDQLGLFDIVVGNPPYVRAGTIDHAVRLARAAVLQADWPELDRSALDTVARLADISASCILRALRLTRPGGRLALVVSTALIETDGAAPLWQLVSRIADVRALVVAPRERWFDDAAVNSMLLVAERRTSNGAIPVRMLRLRSPTVDVVRDVGLRAVAAHGGDASLPLDAVAGTSLLGRGRWTGLDAIAVHADERAASAAHVASWRPALRAPAAWWRWLDIARGLVVPLRELAEIRRGLTTGANDVFYVTRADARALRLEPEYLRPVVRSPFNGSPAPIAIDPDDAPLLAITLPPDPRVLRRSPHVRAWLARHEAKIAGTSVERRDPWWSLRIEPARLFLAKAYGPRFVQRLAPVPVVADQRVYALHPKPGVDVEILAAVLNALPTALALESLGRASLGYGAIEWTVRDAHELPVLDVRRISVRQAAALRDALAAFGRRPIEHVRFERDRDDRAALDLAALELADAGALYDELWTALLESVALRDRYLLPPVGSGSQRSSSR